MVLKYNNSKATNFEINAAPLCLGNVSKDFSADNTKLDYMDMSLEKSSIYSYNPVFLFLFLFYFYFSSPLYI